MDSYEDLDAYLYHRHTTGPADHPDAFERAADAGEHAMQHRALRSSPETFADPVTLADDVALSLDYVDDCMAELYTHLDDRPLAVSLMESIQSELHDIRRILRVTEHDTTMTRAVATTMTAHDEQAAVA